MRHVQTLSRFITRVPPSVIPPRNQLCRPNQPTFRVIHPSSGLSIETHSTCDRRLEPLINPQPTAHHASPKHWHLIFTGLLQTRRERNNNIASKASYDRSHVSRDAGCSRGRPPTSDASFLRGKFGGMCLIYSCSIILITAGIRWIGNIHRRHILPHASLKRIFPTRALPPLFVSS